ncbi:N-acetyltransferase family protein [Halobacteriales archaeon Cl-PHB]
MAGVRFRQAAPGDAAGVLTVKRAAIRELAGWHYDADQIDAWAPDDDALPAFETALESDRYVVLLAERPGGTTLGYGVLNVPADRIDAAFVHPDHTGDGIATSLVGQLETTARLSDVTELSLVASRNARKFYESLGYVTVDDVTREIAGVPVEFAVMRRSLEDESGA